MIPDEAGAHALRISEIFRQCSLRTRARQEGKKRVGVKPGGWQVYNRYAATALAKFKAGEIDHVSEYAGLPQTFEPVALAMTTVPGWFAQLAGKVGEASLSKAQDLEQSVSDVSGRALVSEQACKVRAKAESK